MREPIIHDPRAEDNARRLIEAMQRGKARGRSVIRIAKASELKESGIQIEHGLGTSSPVVRAIRDGYIGGGRTA